MSRPTSKKTLLEAGEAGFQKLIGFIDELSPEARVGEFPFEDRDTNVRDVVGHLHEWHLMMERWYAVGMTGEKPAMPREGYTWKTLPDLDREVWKVCQKKLKRYTKALAAGPQLR